MSDKNLAKVACTAAALYKAATESINSGEQIQLFTPLQDLCQVKKVYFECRAEYHQSKQLLENGKYGEAVARLKKIEPAMKSLVSQKNSPLGPRLKSFNAVYQADKTAIEKDNNFIYLDVVPKTSNLEPIVGFQVAKAKPFNDEERLSAKFTDMFSALLPLSVKVAMEAYDAKRTELVMMQTQRLKDKTGLMNGVMSSLNLPASLEDVNSKGGDLPASILEKSKTVVSKGGSGLIDQLLKDLPDALDRNQQILNESVRLLNDEQASDTELRNKFGARWTRKPSDTLTTSMRSDIAKYQSIIENAKKADGIVKEKYATHREGIHILGLAEPELGKQIPSASSLSSLKDHEVIKELKILCEKVETIKAEREVIENEFRETKSDMSETFLQALSEDGLVDESSISPRQLDLIYQPLIQQVNESADKQESLLANVQRASEQFSVLKQQTAGINKREEVLKKVAAAFDGFQELSAHLSEGMKFYTDLTNLLLKLQGKCSDLVFARKTEKDELMSDLQQNIIGSASEGAASHPAVPAYQIDARSAPPARPPPPVISSATSAPVPAPRSAPPAAAQASQQPAQSHQQPPYGGGSAPPAAAPPAAAAASHQQPPYGGGNNAGKNSYYSIYPRLHWITFH